MGDVLWILGGAIAIVLALALLRLAWSAATQVKESTDQGSRDRQQSRDLRQVAEDDREPVRLRNRDTAERVHDFVLGRTHDANFAKGEAAWVADMLDRGFKVHLTERGLEYEENSHSRGSKQY